MGIFLNMPQKAPGGVFKTYDTNRVYNNRQYMNIDKKM